MKMKCLVFIVSMIFLDFNLSSQTPLNDLHWIESNSISDEFTDSASFNSRYNDFYLNTLIHKDGSLYQSELQCYRRENVEYNGGRILLKAIKETVAEKVDRHLPDTEIMIDGIQNLRQFNYTSGAFETQSRLSYGFIEIKCKIPKGFGFWPAFWLHYNPGGCNKGIEIDILEPNGKDSETARQYRTNRFYTYSGIGTCEKGNDPNLHENLPDLSTGFHKYAIEWSPNKITYYFDDRPIRVIGNAYIPNEPMTLKVNLAIDPWNETR
jgi:beta-glucanase (GH16 family)